MMGNSTTTDMFVRGSARANRATAIPLAFILILGLVVLGTQLYQFKYVPTEGHDEEVDANRDMKTDVLEFDFAVEYAMATGQPQPVAIGSSVDYPIAFPTPPDPAYAIRTTENETIDFDNFECVKGDCEGSFNTTTVIFLGNYNYFQDAQVYGYEYGVAYSAPNNTTEGGNGTVAHTDQSIINGKNLSMMRFHGNFTATGQNTVTTVVKPGSVRKETYTISGNSSDPINITIPTELSESEWQTLMEDEMEDNGGYITNMNYTNYTYDTSDNDQNTGSADNTHWYECEHSGGGKPFVDCTKDNSTNYVTFSLDPEEEYTVTSYVMELSE